MMTYPRRHFLRLASGAAALSAIPGIARAQAYPSRPVRIIVGTAAAGVADILARQMGQWLSERLGQPFVIENRTGAGASIGTEAVVGAPGRPYAAPDRFESRNRCDHLRKAQLQFHPRHRTDRDYRPTAYGHGGESVGTGQDGSRVYCLCQG